MSRLIAFLRRHIELAAIVPVLLALLAGAWAITWYRGLPALEVGPILADYLAGLLPILLLGYVAWWFVREYWLDPSDDDEREWHRTAASTPWSALALIAVLRGSYLVLLGLLLWAFM